MFYVRIAKIFALYYEWNTAFTKKPFLHVYACHDDLIFDMPYSQLIITGPRGLKKKKDVINAAKGNAVAPISIKGASDHQSGISYPIRDMPYRNITQRGHLSHNALRKS